VVVIFECPIIAWTATRSNLRIARLPNVWRRFVEAAQPQARGLLGRDESPPRGAAIDAAAVGPAEDEVLALGDALPLLRLGQGLTPGRARSTSRRRNRSGAWRKTYSLTRSCLLPACLSAAARRCSKSS
jgi:hypothetical protein